MEASYFATKMGLIGDGYVARIDGIGSLTSLAVNADEEKFLPEAELQHLSPQQQDSLYIEVRRIAEELKESVARSTSGTLAVQVGAEDPEIGDVLSRGIWRALNAQRRVPVVDLLSRSVLSLIVTEFEYLVAQVARLILMRRPSLLGSDQTLTLQDLEDLGSVEDARLYLISKRVDALLREPPQDWAKWFGKIGVKWEDMTDDWSSFLEIFARRNIYTHAGGEVTRQYRNMRLKAGEDEAGLPVEGSTLELGEEYLIPATEHLLSFGFLLVAGTKLKFASARAESREVELWIAARVRELLELRHFSAARRIAEVVLQQSKGRMKRSTEINLKTSLWVARTHLDGASSVRREIEDWEVDGLDLKYAHVKSVLLQDWDSAVREVNELCGREELTKHQLIFNPLYSGLLAARRDAISVLRKPQEAGDDDGEEC